MRGFARNAAVCGLAVLALLAAGAGRARAAHWGTATSCYNCHDLNGSAIEPGTRLISKAAMTELKGVGWTSSRRIGCTFCHRSVNQYFGIPDALSGFTTSGNSHHPVGRNFVTKADDNSAHFSTDNTVTAQHLDCVDCHDVTLTSYWEHDNTTWLNDNASAPAQRRKSTNPYGLRDVSAPKAYDNLCRDCHGRPGAFDAFMTSISRPKSGAGASKLALSAHDNAAPGFPIRDLDNTNLRTQDNAQAANQRQCSMCHDAHMSANDHLFSDGHEKDWTGAGETPIDAEGDCTNVCHYRGDPAGNFDIHGHGKPLDWRGYQLAQECTLCHVSTSPHKRSDNNYLVRYRFPNLDPSWTATAGSAFGNPAKSVCGLCHNDKKVHQTARGFVGCIDCHDQHAKSSDNNVMMIRSTNRVANPWGIIGGGAAGATVGSEAVLFQKSMKYPAVPSDNVYHYFTNVPYGTGDPSHAGFCDQRACHGARALNGVPFTPLDNYLASGQHNGGTITTPNGNCEGCHSHDDSGGSFRASSVCTKCHGQPPPPQDNSAGDVYVYNEFLSPHRKHAGANPTSGYYPFDCRKCHLGYADGATHNTTPKTFQSVIFDNAVKRPGAAYDNGTLTCTNITCHSDGRGGAPNVDPRWFDTAQPTVRQRLNCNGCHNTAMSTGSHSAHLAMNFKCSACHVYTVSDNNSVLNATTGIQYHVNGGRDVTIAAAFDVDANAANNWDNSGQGTCTGITCHGGTSVVWNPPTPLPCDSCHSYTAGVEVAANVYNYSFDNGTGIMSKIALANFRGRGHGDNVALPWDNASIPNTVARPIGCATCHDSGVPHDNASNPFRFRPVINGSAVAADNVDSLCTAAYCHPNFAVRADRHASAVTGGGQRGLSHAQKCVDCHDVHGQNNIYMVYDNLAAQVDGTYANSSAFGIPVNPAARTAVPFAANASGADYASTDNAAPFNGICEVCHTRTNQFRNAAGANSGRGPGGAHPGRACTECHRHGAGAPAIDNGGGFAGVGGNNIEHFFDNSLRSGHPLTRSTSGRTWPAQRDCLRCHGAGTLPSANQSNECLTCHYEFAWGTTPYHPNGTYEWAIPRTPGASYGSGAATDGFCLQCHGGGADNAALKSVAPVNIVPAGESWTGPSPPASGHGASSSRLSSDTSVGPPAYSCRTCHNSTVPAAASPVARDNNAPTFHASLNRKMVGNENAASHEYPHPLDNDARYDTADERSARMDWFCGTKCHANTGNAAPGDDNVVVHTWDKLGGGSQAGTAKTHPSNMPPVPDARYRAPDNLPLSENYTGAPPAGSGNVVCVTCHNPHGGAAVVDGSGAPLTGGNKQMMRRSFSDNASTICKECHK